MSCIITPVDAITSTSDNNIVSKSSVDYDPISSACLHYSNEHPEHDSEYYKDFIPYTISRQPQEFYITIPLQ